MQPDPVAVDRRAADRYAELGVGHLVVYPLPLADPTAVIRFVEQHADLRSRPWRH